MFGFFITMVSITAAYGLYAILIARNIFSLGIFLLALNASFLAYCGIRLKDIFTTLTKPRPAGSVIPKSEAKKDFRYLYVCTSNIKNDEMREDIERLFKQNGYQVIADVDSLDDAAKEKVLWAYFKRKEEENGSFYTISLYGKNKDGQTVYSVTKKSESLAKAKREAFEALEM